MSSPRLESFLADTSVDRLSAFSRRMSQDRSRFDSASRDSDVARAEMSACGLEVPSGVEIRLVRQEADVIHFTIPVDPNFELREGDLAAASAGIPLSSFGSIGTLPSTVLTVSTAKPGGERVTTR